MNQSHRRWLLRKKYFPRKKYFVRNIFQARNDDSKRVVEKIRTTMFRPSDVMIDTVSVAEQIVELVNRQTKDWSAPNTHDLCMVLELQPWWLQLRSKTGPKTRFSGERKKRKQKSGSSHVIQVHVAAPVLLQWKHLERTKNFFDTFHSHRFYFLIWFTFEYLFPTSFNTYFQHSSTFISNILQHLFPKFFKIFIQHHT